MTTITIPKGTYSRLRAMETVHNLAFPSDTVRADGVAFDVEDLTAIAAQLAPLARNFVGIPAMIAELEYYQLYGND